MRNMAHYPRNQSSARGFFTCLIGVIVIGGSVLAISVQMIEWTLMRLAP